MQDDEFLQDLNNLPSQIATHDQIDIENQEINTMLPDTIPDTSIVETCADDVSGLSALSEDEIEKIKANKTQDYVLDACKKIVANGYDTLASIQDTVISTVDGKAINGYATLIGSLAKVLDTANSIANNKLQLGNQVRLEQMKAAAKQAAASQSNKTTNNFNIVASREEIMKMLDTVYCQPGHVALFVFFLVPGWYISKPNSDALLSIELLHPL